MTKKNVTPSSVNAAAEIEKARELVAKTEKIEKEELDSVSKEVESFLKNLNDRGFGVAPCGRFVGNQIDCGLKVVKIVKQ